MGMLVFFLAVISLVLSLTLTSVFVSFDIGRWTLAEEGMVLFRLVLSCIMSLDPHRPNSGPGFRTRGLGMWCKVETINLNVL